MPLDEKETVDEGDAVESDNSEGSTENGKREGGERQATDLIVNNPGDISDEEDFIIEEFE